MDYYSIDNSALVFRESLKVLEIGCPYTARFVVYSRVSQELQVHVGSHLKGVIKLHPKKIKLGAGINTLEFNFELSSNYGYRSSKRTEEHSQLPMPAFKLGPLALVSRVNVTVSTMIQRRYSIPSQNKVLSQLQNFFSRFLRNNLLQLVCIRGQSAVGKSHILDSFIKSSSRSDVLVFSSEMSEHPHKNYEDLIRCIDYIYFPFLPIGSVTKDYLDQLAGSQFVTPFYYEIACCDHTAESLGRLFSRYVSEDSVLFPRRLYVNPRLIIIDNFHKGNDLVVNVIYKIILELSMIKAPLMFILAGQMIRHNSSYMELKKTIPVKEIELFITVPDCMALIPQEQLHQEVRQLLQANFRFSNIMELLFFAEYVLDHGNYIKNFNDFTTLYHLFFYERMMDVYIGRLFQGALRSDPAADLLCNEVYWNSFGVDGADQPSGRKLLSYHVAKIDPFTGRLIPYHDIYTYFYRKNYPHRAVINVPFVELLEGNDVEARETGIKNLHQAYDAKQYAVVYYSLEPVYHDEGSDVYKNFLDETTCSRGEVSNHMLNECDAIKNAMEISKRRRPFWDAGFLEGINFSVRLDEDISHAVHKDKRCDYDSVPLFAIHAVK